jgi:hypothetical protein
MDPILRTKIITVLTSLLQRAPTENEIQNAQTDINVMLKVMQLP